MHAPAQEFFIPDDFEISRDELVDVCEKATTWRGAKGSIRRLQVQKLIEKDADDAEFLEITKLYKINEMDADGGNKKIYRQFMQDPRGCITEIFAEFKIGAATGQYDHLKLYTPPTVGAGGANKDEVIPTTYTPTEAKKRTSRGVFAGLEKA